MKRYITIEKYLNQKEKNNNKIFWYIILFICIIVFIITFYNLFKWGLDNFKIYMLNKKIKENINTNITNDKDVIFINPPEDKTSNYYYYINFPFNETDFHDLIKQNKDTIAFIRIKNTSINYPVVKTYDNNYYLNHSYDNKKNNAGWIFMDYRNSITKLSDNTIIYGHSRIDGTLFGSLRNVLKDAWQENLDNYIIYLSTLEENMLFLIFSIYTINSESYYIMDSFNSINEKQEWINTMKRRNISPIKTEVDINDNFLTLSTCQNTKGGRIVVHAKLIKKQKNNTL